MSTKKRTALAFDFGASSGRAVLAHYENESLRLEEIHRFPNQPVSYHGHLYWDVLGLFQEIKNGIRKASQNGGFDSIGIDTWGVDYGLIDKHGALLGNPYHYRDTRTVGLPEKSAELIPPEKLYMLTGNQILNINTAFQLLEQKQNAPELLENAQAFLLMPDLFAYLLTGDISSELSIAGTTQLCNPYSGGWSGEVIKALGLPEHIFPAMAQTGTVKGMLSEEICQELNVPSVPVIAVCGHDTQCASASIPALDRKPFAFISCGTWALFGTELKKPVINGESASLGISNEIGFENTVTFLKNITGTWLLQELRRTLKNQGKEYSYADLEKMAVSAEGCQRFIDVDAPAFSTPGDMAVRVRDWCIESGQPVPADIPDVLRCIYESLSCRFRDALDEIQHCTNQKCEKIYMLGGGVKDRLLCQLTADACRIPVCTGSEEATAYGNAVIQLIASGVVPDLLEARWLIAKSIKSKTYTPNSQNFSMYENYQKLFKSYK